MENTFSDAGEHLKKSEEKKSVRYNKFWYSFIVFTFCVFLFTVLVLRAVLPTPTVSTAENRELKKMPSTDAENIFFGKFTTEFEDFFSDTFPARDTLLGAGDYVSWLYKIPVEGVDSVVVMNENMIQDAGGDGEDTGGGSQDEDASAVTQNTADTEVTQAPTGTVSPVQPNSSQDEENTPPAEDTEQEGIYLITDDSIFMEYKLNQDSYTRLANGVNQLASQLPGKRVIIMSAPSSFAFYADPKYKDATNDQKAGITDMYSKIDPSVYKVDAYPNLDAHKNDYIYFRTDHHWTALGAYLGYKAYCDTLGLVAAPLDGMKKTTFSKNFLGAFYTQTKAASAKAKVVRNSPDYVDYYTPTAKCSLTMFERNPLKDGKSIPLFDLDLPKGTTNYYYVFLGGDFPCIKISTDTMNGKSVFLLKDSYANAFAPYLTANYQYIYLVDFRDFNTKGLPDFNLVKFVNDNNIDDVLLEINFRYTNIPDDVTWYLKAFS